MFYYNLLHVRCVHIQLCANPAVNHEKHIYNNVFPSLRISFCFFLILPHFPSSLFSLKCMFILTVCLYFIKYSLYLLIYPFKFRTKGLLYLWLMQAQDPFFHFSYTKYKWHTFVIMWNCIGMTYVNINEYIIYSYSYW